MVKSTLKSFDFIKPSELYDGEKRKKLLHE